MDEPAEPVTLRNVLFGTPLTFHLNGVGDPVSSYFRHGVSWHPAICRFLSKRIGPGQVFVDVGAHIGVFSVLAAYRAGPTGRVIAFEPEPANRALLARNAAANGVTVDIRPRAVAGAPGQVGLYGQADNKGGWSLMPDGAAGPDLVVEATTLEAELAGLERIDFLKLDVQGAEPAILESTMSLWRRFPRAPMILFEFNPRSWQEHDPGFRMLQAFITAYRYDVHPFLTSEGVNVTPPPISPRTLLAIAGDYLRYGRSGAELDILLYPP
jgi:FkbM family methyltransferase